MITMVVPGELLVALIFLEMMSGTLKELPQLINEVVMP